MSATDIHTLRNAPTAAPKPTGMKDIAKLDRKKQFPAMLEAFKHQIAMALPEHLSPERMARLAMTAFSANPKLAECDPQSVFAAVILSSQLGLEIGVDGEAFLVPYRDRRRGMIANFIPGWKGYVKLVNQAKMATVWTGAVFEGDKFEFALGDSPYVKHQPTGKTDETKANLLFTYAIGRIHEAEWPVIEVWPRAKIDRHLARFNKVGEGHYALKDDTNFIAYGRKVALLQVIKYLPKSVKLIAATAVDQSGSAHVDIKDVIEGDWSNVTAEAEAAAAQDTDGGDQADAQADQSGQPSDSGAAGAESSPQTGPEAGQATAASESPTQAKPKRQRRVIE